MIFKKVGVHTAFDVNTIEYVQESHTDNSPGKIVEHGVVVGLKSGHSLFFKDETLDSFCSHVGIVLEQHIQEEVKPFLSSDEGVDKNV